MIRLFRVFVPGSVLALLVSELLVIFGCYLLAAYLLQFINLNLVQIVPLDYDATEYLFFVGTGASRHFALLGIFRLTLVAACIMIGNYFHDLYGVTSRILRIDHLCVSIGLAFLAQALLIYLKRPEWTVPRTLMILGSLLVLLLLPLWRIFYSVVVLRAFGRQRVLFLGTSPAVCELAEHLADHPEIGLMNVGYVDNVEGAPELPGGRLLGPIHDLASIVDKCKPHRIVVGMTERRQRLPVNELLDLRFSGVHIEDVLSVYEATFGRVCTRELRPSQLVFTAELGPSRNSEIRHSLYSLFIALILTVATIPIMLIVAVLVKLTTPGPVLHRQLRVGLNDAPFMVYKFRSMRADAEKGTGAVWAVRNDPRITPLGRWLRKLRLDELPQLFNVLKGEMSIVGPRPERPEFVKTLTEQIPYYRQRHCVKPGITGWAQINHKYGDTLEDTVIKLEYDLYYIKNLAITLDSYIMFHTLKVMLLSRGAQ
jgi:sugar transferase (PEP-CTERM system associated)